MLFRLEATPWQPEHLSSLICLYLWPPLAKACALAPLGTIIQDNGRVSDLTLNPLLLYVIELISCIYAGVIPWRCRKPHLFVYIYIDVYVRDGGTFCSPRWSCWELSPLIDADSHCYPNSTQYYSYINQIKIKSNHKICSAQQQI